MLDLTLGLVFHGDELACARLYLISLLPFPKVFVLFVSYAALEQLFLLGDQNALHSQGTLLLLQFGLAYALCMLFFGSPVLLFDSLEPFAALLLANQFVFHFFLVTVASLQQLLGFLIGNVGQLFGTLLFKDETLDPIL